MNRDKVHALRVLFADAVLGLSCGVWIGFVVVLAAGFAFSTAGGCARPASAISAPSAEARTATTSREVEIHTPANTRERSAPVLIIEVPADITLRAAPDTRTPR